MLNVEPNTDLISGNLLTKSLSLFILSDSKVISSPLREEILQTIHQLLEGGYVRLHAFLMNWIGIYTNSGLLEERELSELADSLPWSWDQSKEYLDLLEINGLIRYERRPDKKKVCLLNLSSDYGQLTDLSRLLHYYSSIFYSTDFTQSNLSDLSSSYVRCLVKSQKVKESKRLFETKQGCITCASEGDTREFLIEIASAYLYRSEDDSLDTTTRIVSVLAKNPLLIKGLKKKEI